MSVLNQNVVSVRLARARQALGLEVQYHMGRGGFNHDLPNPPECFNWDDNRSDCSGFLSAVMQTKRAPKPGIRDFWIETTEMVHDVRNAQQCFVPVDGEPGCFVAYGDSDGESGHCALITGITRDASGTLTALRGIDCSHGSYVRTGDAIHEHDILPLFNTPACVFFAFRQDLA